MLLDLYLNVAGGYFIIFNKTFRFKNIPNIKGVLLLDSTMSYSYCGQGKPRYLLVKYMNPESRKFVFILCIHAIRYNLSLQATVFSTQIRNT